MNDTPEAQDPAAVVAPLTLRERFAAWWATVPNNKRTSGLALAAVLIAFTLLCTWGQKPKPAPAAPQPAAVQTNPLAPLVARIEALEAQVTDLQEPQPAAAPWPAPRRAPASAPAAPVAPYRGPQAPQAPTAQPWGTTDLDRAIALHKRVIPELFPTNTTTGAQQ